LVGLAGQNLIQKIATTGRDRQMYG